MDSQEIKIAVASFFRFKRMYEIVATEYRFKIDRKTFYADIIASNMEEVIEFEVKTNKNDVYADKINKRVKHEKYISGESKFTPNRFYFVLTSELSYDRNILNYIININPNYGIIRVSKYDEDTYNIDTIRPGRYIHTRTPDKIILREMTKKVSAENILLREKLFKINNKKATQ